MNLQDAIDTLADGNQLRVMTRHNAADFVEATAVVVDAARKYAEARRAFQGAQGEYRDGSLKSWVLGVADALGFDLENLDTSWLE